MCVGGEGGCVWEGRVDVCAMHTHTCSKIQLLLNTTFRIITKLVLFKCVLKVKLFFTDQIIKNSLFIATDLLFHMRKP